MRIHHFVHGRGRGHATRALPIVRQLRDAGHEVVLHARDTAMAMLRDAGHHPHTLAPVPRGIRSLAMIATATRHVVSQLQREGADLVIGDGDPIGLLAGRRVGIPTIAVGHNVVFTHGSLPGAPRKALWAERANAGLSTQATWAVGANFLPLDSKTPTATFGRPDPRWDAAPTPRDDGFVLSYFRDGEDGGAATQAAHLGYDVHVFGSYNGPGHPRVTRHPADDDVFLDHLARCHAVVATGGSNLITEAIYLRKPIYCLYGRGDFEQALNVYMLRNANVGDGQSLRSEPQVGPFLSRVAQGGFASVDLARVMPTVSSLVVDRVRAIEQST